MILDLDPVGVIGSDLVQSHDMHGDAQFHAHRSPQGRASGLGASPETARLYTPPLALDH